IPEILGATDEGNGKTYEKPQFCPFCGSALKESGANLFCVNRQCKPRVAAMLDHFAGKNAMDIDGFSENTALLLIDRGKIKTCSDLYRLKAEDFEGLEGFKQKKINNLLTAIEKSRTPTLSAFIYALGIEGIGRVAAKDLAAAFGSFEGVKNASYEQLIALDNIGGVTANNVLSHFADRENLAEIQALFALGVTIKEEPEKNGNGVFYGEKVVLTGVLSAYSRSEAQKLIESEGGECLSGVSSRTTLVIAGEDAGSKLEKAKKLGVKIIGEAEFLAALSKSAQKREEEKK
ncbi:MAG: helix-hairpin-helix domain-containing protein, partial [Candidatus Borkfalkiaceae bacterium]|nr:helix-hairpin-helix domain-containing protein [Clostridia bacterium]MDY6223307.1 helix-hairpin-helix domain-containing protein [Christensenellaceae bacterium]